MNKLEGLYELKKMSIPAIDWRLYERGMVLSKKYLWTIRTAVYRGSDFHLPRLFGKDAETAMKFAERCLMDMGDSGIVICYPYLHAVKSGVVQFDLSAIQLEGISGELSNLLDGDSPEASYCWKKDKFVTKGKADFFSDEELGSIIESVSYCRRRYRNLLHMGQLIQMEFSFAFDVDNQGKDVGEQRLVFFEIRTV